MHLTYLIDDLYYTSNYHLIKTIKRHLWHSWRHNTSIFAQFVRNKLIRWKNTHSNFARPDHLSIGFFAPRTSRRHLATPAVELGPPSVFVLYKKIRKCARFWCKKSAREPRAADPRHWLKRWRSRRGRSRLSLGLRCRSVVKFRLMMAEGLLETTTRDSGLWIVSKAVRVRRIRFRMSGFFGSVGLCVLI